MVKEVVWYKYEKLKAKGVSSLGYLEFSQATEWFATHVTTEQLSLQPLKTTLML